MVSSIFLTITLSPLCWNSSNGIIAAYNTWEPDLRQSGSRNKKGDGPEILTRPNIFSVGFWSPCRVIFTGLSVYPHCQPGHYNRYHAHELDKDIEGRS